LVQCDRNTFPAGYFRSIMKVKILLPGNHWQEESVCVQNQAPSYSWASKTDISLQEDVRFLMIGSRRLDMIIIDPTFRTSLLWRF
jgi:hypothetical protein